MALSAGRLHVPCRQDRLLPGQGAAWASSTVVAGLAPGDTSRSHTGQACAGLPDACGTAGADIGEAGFFQTGVASGAAVDDSQLRKPYLLDAIVIVKVALERDRVSTAANQRQILLLIVAPFAEVVLGGSDCQKSSNSRLTTPKARTGWPNNVCHREDNESFFDCDDDCKSAPPGQHPGPAWAAEESANRREHREFEQKPGHDPERKRFRSQTTPEGRCRLRRTLHRQIMNAATIRVGTSATYTSNDSKNTQSAATAA
jgi:hypothetical protein